MDVRHDYVDPDDVVSPASVRVEPVRRGSVRGPLVHFVWSAILSIFVFLAGADPVISWLIGILVGTTGVNFTFACIERRFS